MRGSKAIRTAAWALVAAGVAAPLLRRHTKVPPIVAQTVAFAAPVALCVAVRRSRARDVTVCCLQMWAYLAAYKTPHDDAEAQQERVHIDYPIDVDRVLGLGELPTVRLQRAFAKVGAQGPEWRKLDRVLVWAHWVWFAVPHGTLVYIMVRHRARFDRAAVMTYAVFDLGAMVYWVLPTAPPWYAAAVAGRHEQFDGDLFERTGSTRSPDRAYLDGAGREDVDGVGREGWKGAGHEIAVRRMMVEYGQFFWKDGWGPLYSVLGGNPFAAMPSLHFATSIMAAQLLSETGPVAGALGWGYATTLGLALVYLGEHYVVDLVAGAALTTLVRRGAPVAVAPLKGFARAVAALEAAAHER